MGLKIGTIVNLVETNQVAIMQFGKELHTLTHKFLEMKETIARDRADQWKMISDLLKEFQKLRDKVDGKD